MVFAPVTFVAPAPIEDLLMPLYGPAGSAATVVSGSIGGTVVAERLDGSVVILWIDRSPGSNQYDVRGKVVAADGTVLVADFLVSASADGYHRIIYDGATGQLFYEADGNGAGAQVLFATLTGAPVVAATDFLVI
jgi:hypothetical protein